MIYDVQKSEILKMLQRILRGFRGQFLTQLLTQITARIRVKLTFVRCEVKINRQSAMAISRQQCHQEREKE